MRTRSGRARPRNWLPRASQPKAKSPIGTERRASFPRPKPISIVNDRFSAALKHLGAALLETSHVTNSGIKGGKREEAFRHFVQQRLPSRFGVATGEVVDQFNLSSPQLDVLIFDKMRDFSLSDGDIQILPAEALLASIEVKSKLTASEIRESSQAARKLRALRPFGSKLGGRDMGALEKDSGKRARYLHCLFAYNTDIVEADWVNGEASRFIQHQQPGEHLVDVVYVLDRGVLYLSDGRGRSEDKDGSAITTFYFTILNFIERESRRRPQTPYQDYASRLAGRDWKRFK
jgi:uncharacterized protein DUF6602